MENPISSKVQLEIINKCSSLNISSLEESLELILKNKEFINPFKELELLKDLYFCRFQDCSKVLKKKANIISHLKDHFKETSTPRDLKEFYQVINFGQSLGINRNYFLVQNPINININKVQIINSSSFNFQEVSSSLLESYKKKEEDLLEKSKVLDYNPLIDKLSPFQIRT